MYINEQDQIAGTSATANGETHAVLWTTSLQATTPRVQIEVIKADVNTLFTQGVLNTGQAPTLETKRDAALAKLKRGNTTAAANPRQVFVNQATAFGKSKIRSAQQARSLIEKANTVISPLRR